MSVTNEGWPEPNDWINRLKNNLIFSEEQYFSFSEIRKGEVNPEEFGNPEVENTDPRSNQLLILAQSVGILLKALKEFPAFNDNQGLVPIQDLLAALHRLDEGGKSELLKPRSVDKLERADSISRRFVKHHAVLCVEVLKAVGQKQKTSQETTAAIFSQAGHKGRKGGNLSWKTVNDWCTQCDKQGEDQQGYKWVTMKLDEFRASPEWPPTENNVRGYVGRIANSRELKTKSD